MPSPVPYMPEVETIQPDEQETIDELIATLREIADTTYSNSGEVLRGVHAKAHGVLKAELEVLDGLSTELAQGLFAAPGTYPAFMRFSTNPGDILDDTVSLPRGLALKIAGVGGERLTGSEPDTTQDFVLVNSPAFSASSTKAFLKNLKLLAKTTDRAEGAKKILSAALRGVETLIESVGGESGLVKQLGGQPPVHILGETFFSQAPIRYGRYIAKVSVAPASPELVALSGQMTDLSKSPNALREDVQTFFRAHDAEWELRVQLCNDLKTMPIEDATVVWPENESPYLPVARINVKRQDAWSEDAVKRIDQGMAFGPWHGLAAHQPLGLIMRARRETYRASANLRSQRSGCPIHEPALRNDR